MCLEKKKPCCQTNKMEREEYKKILSIEKAQQMFVNIF